MRELLREVFEPNRWNVAAGGLVVVLLFVAYVLVPQPLVQYSAWLVIFTVWMSWFIFAGMEWLSKADF